MSAVLQAIKARALPVWTYLRAVLGDQAYERYVEITRRHGETPLSAREFYLESVQRRYSTVSRCC